MQIEIKIDPSCTEPKVIVQAAFLRMAALCRLTSVPRFQRFHDSTVGNGLHENASRAFRGNRWERGNRAFVAFVAIVGIVATVGFVGMRGTVISLESLVSWAQRKKSLPKAIKNRAQKDTLPPRRAAWYHGAVKKQTGRQGPRKGWFV